MEDYQTEKDYCIKIGYHPNDKQEQDELAKMFFEYKQHLIDTGGMVPAELPGIGKLLAYANKYQISIQLWGDDNTNVYIEKGGVDLIDFGGLSPQQAITETLNYLNKINRIAPLEHNTKS